MGKGIRLDASLEVTQERFTGLFSVYNPNFNYSDNSLQTTIRNTVTERMDNYGYESTNTGISIGTGFEQYTDFRISPSFHIGYETLDTNQSATEYLRKQEGN